MAPRTHNQFVVLYGNNSFALDREVERFLKSTGRVIVRLDGEDHSERSLIEQCWTAGEPRTLLIDNAGDVKSDKSKPLKKFIEDLDNPDIQIVAIVRGEKLSDTWETLGERGIKKRHTLPPPWKDQEYTAFILNEAKLNRVKIEFPAIDLLLKACGQDFYRLSNEIGKLALYVGSPGTVTAKHVVSVVTFTPQAEPHKVADACFAKDPKQAFELFNSLYANEGDPGCIRLCTSLMFRLIKLLEIKNLQSRGVPDSEIETLVELKHFPYEKLWAPAAAKHEFKSLVKYMGIISKLDSYVKLGHSKRTMLEMVMINIST